MASAGHDLAGDLVDRPVPGRDQAADADRLLDDARRAAVFLELKFFSTSMAVVMWTMPRPAWAPRPGGRRAHFLGDGVGDVAEALLVFGQDALQQVDALLAAGLGIGLERPPGGLDGLVDVGGRAGGDVAARPPRWPGCHIEGLGRDRVDPLAVDVEFHVFAHRSPFRSCLTECLRHTRFGTRS